MLTCPTLFNLRFNSSTVLLVSTRLTPEEVLCRRDVVLVTDILSFFLAAQYCAAILKVLIGSLQVNIKRVYIVA